jgi:hypothetical protein
MFRRRISSVSSFPVAKIADEARGTTAGDMTSSFKAFPRLHDWFEVRLTDT